LESGVSSCEAKRGKVAYIVSGTKPENASSQGRGVMCGSNEFRGSIQGVTTLLGYFSRTRAEDDI